VHAAAVVRRAQGRCLKMKTMSLFRRNCRQVTALILAEQDRPLGLIERLAVRLHMLICNTCPTFHRQAALMREALPRWRAYRDSVD
jgi:hypothetical protein